MNPFDETKLNEQNAKLENDLKKERENWMQNLKELIDMLKVNSKLTEAMAYGLSYRQMIVEKCIQYKQLLAKKNSVWDKVKADRYKQYILEGDLKLTATEKNDFVTADITSLKYQISLLQGQIEFFQETVQTLNSFQFAIKNKLQIITEEIM